LQTLCPLYAIGRASLLKQRDFARSAIELFGYDLKRFLEQRISQGQHFIVISTLSTRILELGRWRTWASWMLLDIVMELTMSLGPIQGPKIPQLTVYLHQHIL